jgi:hypothetical protein
MRILLMLVPYAALVALAVSAPLPPGTSEAAMLMPPEAVAADHTLRVSLLGALVP